MGFFSSSTSVRAIPLTREQRQARTYLSDLLGAGTPNFPAMGVAGMSPAEAQAQGLLSQYLSGAPAGYEAAMGELDRTLTGQYDPRTSDMYKGLRQQSLLDEEEAVSRLRRGAQAGGMFYSEPSMRSEARLRAGYGADRTSLLGGLYERERDRRLGAVPMALQAGQVPLQQVAAGMQYGALPRQLEQMEQSAQYDSLLQQLLFPYMQGQQVAQSLWGMRPDYYLKESPSLFSQIAGVAGTVGQAVAGLPSGGMASMNLPAPTQPGAYNPQQEWGGLPAPW